MRNSVTITIAAGTVQRVIPKGLPEILALDLIITPLKAGTGTIDVLNFDPSTSPTDNAQTLVTQIGPAGASAPAAPFILNRAQDGSPKLVVNEFGVDGSHSGDTVCVSWEPSH